MKKCIFLFVILNICAISTLHSQWLEKEGYWELSEKIPDLRDLKILPEENLIITVSKDNTIRHIEYDSGKILKSGKPNGLPDSNDYAKISSDGKTTVVARYVKNELHSAKTRMTIKDMEIGLVRNIDNSLLVNQKIDADSILGVYYYDKNPDDMFGLEYYNYSIGYFDYFSTENRFFYTINYTLRWEGRANTGGEPTYNVSSGYQRNGSIVDGMLVTTKRYNSHYTNEYIPLDINHENYVLVGSNYYSMGNAHRDETKIHNFVAKKNRINNDLQLQVQYNYNYSSQRGDWGESESESGEEVPIYQLFGSGQSKIFFYRISGKLIEFEVDVKILNTYHNSLFKKVINMSNDSRLIHTIESKDYVIYSFPYYKEIFRVGIDTVFALPRAYLDESNGVVLIPNSARRLVMFKPDVMTDIPKFGFVWSKDTVYTEEQLNFRALTNIEGSKYEWKFSNGEIINSDTNEITHKFLVPDIYGVTLEVIKPDGEKISFVKDSIITVLEIVKADFEATELNSELPLRVQFTDKSNGANTSWTWDFGDGESSTEQNPVYEYKYAGDFSPRLIVSDGIDKDTIIKYEYVINAIPNPIVNVSDKNLHLKTGMTEFQKSFLTDNGINLSWTKHYFIPNGFLNYGDYYAEIFSRNFSFDFAIIDTFAYNHRSSNSFNVKLFHLLLKDKLVFNYNKSEFGITSYNFKDKRLFANKNSKLGAASVILNNIDSTFFWVSNLIVNASVIKTDYDFNIISELSIPPNAKQYLADTLDNGLNLIIREQNNTYSYFSISPENTLNYEQSFSLDTNITLSGIKSVNDNLILLHGFYKDKVNKTTYAYFAKYHPLDNTIQDTILYSRKDIRKIERVNNSTFAAIGQSRGRQGYLLLDTNLHQIKDIRVDSLTGEIKDMILHDKKVYIFTEKIVSLPTMALGANESYQTTASVLAIPEVIIDTVKDTTVISIDKLTHSAYPNPTNEVLNLKVATHQAANYTIKLYDIFGTEILNIHDGYIPANSEKIFSISTSSLSIGSYYYVISGGGLVERGKVLIIR